MWWETGIGMCFASVSVSDCVPGCCHFRVVPFAGETHFVYKTKRVRIAQVGRFVTGVECGRKTGRNTGRSTERIWRKIGGDELFGRLFPHECPIEAMVLLYYAELGDSDSWWV